jgi:hypothetical protein
MIELSKDDLLEIKIALSKLADYTARHDTILVTMAADLQKTQALAALNAASLDQEIRNRSKSDQRLEPLPQLLNQAITDIAILKDNEAQAASRFNIIAGAFWAAIAVAVVAMFQTSNKPRAEADPPDRLVNQPVYRSLPNQ